MCITPYVFRLKYLSAKYLHSSISSQVSLSMASNLYSRVPAVFHDRIDAHEAGYALDALHTWGIYGQEEKELYHAGLEWWIKLRDQRYAMSLSMDISLDISMDISFDILLDIPIGYIHG